MSDLTIRILKDQSNGKPSATPPRRERRYTSWLVTVFLLQLVACGGSSKASHYERAMNKQETCCKGLQDDKERATCMDSIVRINDESVEDSQVNEASFRCVEKDFVCDTATGHATQASSQAALDCISDL